MLKDYYITECKRKGKEKEKNAEISDRIKFLGGFVLVKSRSQGSEINSFPDISSDRSTLDLKNDFYVVFIIDLSRSLIVYLQPNFKHSKLRRELSATIPNLDLVFVLLPLLHSACLCSQRKYERFRFLRV